MRNLRALSLFIILVTFVLSSIIEFQTQKINQIQTQYNDLQKANNDLIQNSNELKQKIESKNTIIEEKTNTIITLRQEIEKLKQDNKEQQSIIDTLKTTPNKNRIPQIPTNMYMSMDYRKITNHRSEQWLLQMDNTYTNKNGIRTYIDKNGREYLTAALAANYGREIGSAWLVTLTNGSEFYVMMGDFKDDGSDPLRMGDPCKNYDNQDCLCVIEFIVEMEKVPREVRLSGTMSSLDFFNGHISSMQYIGDIW